jgi:ribosomal protein L16 Arg81 hydroxylase
MTSFSDFIAPFDPGDFKAHYYGRKPLHIARNSAPFENPLPWKRFNQILDLTPYWNEQTLKVYYQSRGALVENYCDLTRQAPGALAPADPRKVRALLGMGASLVANRIQKVSPEVAAISRAIGREFAAHCVANTYCSFRGVQAFSTHFDLHDVFALQVEGEKVWHVYEARADNPVNPVPPGDEAEKWLIASRGRLLLEIAMKPGDILYLPRGQYHDAITGAAASLHVTFGLEPATGLSLFSLLESLAGRDSAFRAYLPDASQEHLLREHLVRLGKLLERMITSPAFTLDVRNHQRGLSSFPVGFELPNQGRPQYYSPAGRAQLVLRPQGYALVTDAGDVPIGATYPAVDWLLLQRAFSLDDLLARFPFLDEAEMQSVLVNLSGLGVIVKVDLR